jgi:hypothetical protein
MNEISIKTIDGKNPPAVFNSNNQRSNNVTMFLSNNLKSEKRQNQCCVGSVTSKQSDAQ